MTNVPMQDAMTMHVMNSKANLHKPEAHDVFGEVFPMLGQFHMEITYDNREMGLIHENVTKTFSNTRINIPPEQYCMTMYKCFWFLETRESRYSMILGWWSFCMSFASFKLSWQVSDPWIGMSLTHTKTPPSRFSRIKYTFPKEPSPSTRMRAYCSIDHPRF